MPKYLRKVGRCITLTLLDLPSLIQAGHQKKPDAWIRANFSLIGKQKGFSVLPDTPAEIGAISQTDMESRVFVYDFLFLSVDLVLFMLNVRQLQQKSLFCAPINRAFRHFKKLASVRKHQNFEHFMRNALALKVRLRRQCERARYEDLGILD